MKKVFSGPYLEDWWEETKYMSIKIDSLKCTKCGECLKVCPGKLIYAKSDGSAYIKYPRDCWGCAACVKECQSGAVSYYLAADIGGKGAFLYTKNKEDSLDFIVVKDNKKEIISVSKKESNKY